MRNLITHRLACIARSWFYTRIPRCAHRACIARASSYQGFSSACIARASFYMRNLITHRLAFILLLTGGEGWALTGGGHESETDSVVVTTWLQTGWPMSRCPLPYSSPPFPLLLPPSPSFPPPRSSPLLLPSPPPLLLPPPSSSLDRLSPTTVSHAHLFRRYYDNERQRVLRRPRIHVPEFIGCICKM